MHGQQNIKKKHVNRVPDHIVRRLVEDDKTRTTQKGKGGGVTNVYILPDKPQRIPCMRYTSVNGE
jgi:hypothetical protein